MRVHLVHNPAAGDEEHSREALMALIASCGHRVEYHDAKSADWQAAVVADPAAELVAVAGGDGTVGKVARVLSGSGVPIALLPLGTANNVSTMLGIADAAVEDLVRGWKAGAHRACDIGVARGPWGTFRFLESIGTGALAESMSEVAHGSAGHVDRLDAAEERIAAALELIARVVRRAVPFPLQLSLDGRDLSGEFLLAEVLNFGTAGPNLHLSTQANPSDGLLDVVLVGEEQRHALADHLPMYRGDPARAPLLRTVRGARLRLRLRCDCFAVHLDDELWDGRAAPPWNGTIDVTVEKRALRFLVPSWAAAA